MKILLIADEESKFLWDFYQPDKLRGVDLIISCGDLKQEYLEFLVTMASKPLLYVHGNHDTGYEKYPPEGCDCLDDQIINYKGLRIAGLGGCVRYNQGTFQYTEKEMAYRVKRLRSGIKRMKGVDLLITHAPPKGCGDAPDRAHQGFSSFLPLLDEWKPRYLIHGHVHPNYGYHLPQQQHYGETTVFNAVGYHFLEIEPLPGVPLEGPRESWLRRLLSRRK